MNSLLRAKRAAWEFYDTERRRALAWEKMKITSQRGLACPTLLDAVTPVVFYGPPDAMGPVEFTAIPAPTRGKREASAHPSPTWTTAVAGTL